MRFDIIGAEDFPDPFQFDQRLRITAHVIPLCMSRTAPSQRECESRAMNFE
jgi:hypothetical protein